MTNKERTKVIKDELKKLGYGSKQVSVRSRYCGYSDATDIVVKDINCDINKIEEACRKFEHVDYDQYSGEILSGGNTYISVQWDYEVIHKATEEKKIEAERIINKKENGTTIFQNNEKKLILCYDEARDLYDIAEFKNGSNLGSIRVKPCTKLNMVYSLARALATGFKELA